MRLTKAEQEYWKKELGDIGIVLSFPSYAPKVVEQCDRPRCARCGEQPTLGRCGREGGIVPMCAKCANEELMAMLTPEERALMRGRYV